MNCTILFDDTETIKQHTLKFLIVDAKELADSMIDIFNKLFDISWVKVFNGKLREAFIDKARKTCFYFFDNSIMDGKDNKALELMYEKLVTVNSTKALEQKYMLKSHPLGETIKDKVWYNPGFDFYNEDLANYQLVFGEGKYDSDYNPYTLALKQIIDFKNKRVDLDDLTSLQRIANAKSIDNFDCRSFCAGFSLLRSFKFKGKELFDSLKTDNNVLEILEDHDLYLVGVLFENE